MGGALIESEYKAWSFHGDDHVMNDGPFAWVADQHYNPRLLASMGLL